MYIYMPGLRLRMRIHSTVELNLSGIATGTITITRRQKLEFLGLRNIKEYGFSWLILVEWGLNKNFKYPVHFFLNCHFCSLERYCPYI